jgi:hypothetical protein
VPSSSGDMTLLVASRWEFADGLAKFFIAWVDTTA